MAGEIEFEMALKTVLELEGRWTPSSSSESGEGGENVILTCWSLKRVCLAISIPADEI